MNETDVLDILREAFKTCLIVGGPVMLVALVIGLAISLLQALTQIQEMTLSFVPKVICVFLTLILTMPFMLQQLTLFTNQMFDKIVGLQ